MSMPFLFLGWEYYVKLIHPNLINFVNSALKQPEKRRNYQNSKLEEVDYQDV